MPPEYGYCYRRTLTSAADFAALASVDLFISAFNKSERVQEVHRRVPARNKLWIIHKEYELKHHELPAAGTWSTSATDESSYVTDLLDHLTKNFGWSPTMEICIDITGMLRPHLMYLILALSKKGARKVFVIYSEPVRYKSNEDTTFTDGSIYEVRPVHGFEGTPNGDTDRDLLIVGMGFDDRMLIEVCENKEKADKLQLFGWPSLRADMYQQSVIRARSVSNTINDPEFAESNRAFAPANDPFATAAVISEEVSKRRRGEGISNLFLSPLGTKPQALGFALFFIGECQGEDVTIIFPFSHWYAPDTTLGLARAWHFTLEFPI
jgi:hypothetical protein